MREYRLLNDIFCQSLKEVVLENRGIDETLAEGLLNPSVSNVESPFQIPNMDKAIELFIKALDDELKIGIMVDSDVDGYTSSALMYNFLVNECQYAEDKIEVFFHEEKQHGLSDEKIFKKIKKSDVQFLILPDAGTNDINYTKELLKLGKKVLVLDHHNLNNEEDKTLMINQNGELIYVLVNNQLGKYSKAFSGVGVVWKFLSAMTEDELVHYLDLVAVGSVADSMLLNDLELRYVVNKGLENVNNELFKEYMLSSNLEKLTPMAISFNIANKINGTIRYGSITEKVDLFRALIGDKEEIEYTPRKSKTNPNPQTEIQSLQKAMVRVSANAKARQDKAKKTCIDKCKKYIEEKGLDKNKFILVIDEKNSFTDKKITGLVAMGLVDVYKKSVVLLSRSKDGDLIGSARGYGVESLKEIVERTEIIKGTGHDNAFGVFVEWKDLPRLEKRLIKAFEDIEIVPPLLEVDCEIDIDNISEEEIKEILDMEMLYHQHFPTPCFLIRGLELDTKKVKIPYSLLMTFECNGYLFKKEFCSGTFKEEFLCKKEAKFGQPTIKCDLIVEIGFDTYRNKPCFLIKEADSEVLDNKKKKNIPF